MSMRYSWTLIVLLMAPVFSADTNGKNALHKNKPAPKAQPAAVAEDWTVWGGPNRDFIVNASGLADSWPAGGPKRLWSRKT